MISTRRSVNVTFLLMILLGGYALWSSLTGVTGATARPAHLAHLQGPTTPSVIPTIAPTESRRYHTGASSRLAILLTNPSSNWLGIAHGLKAIGVPFVITQDYTEALQHRVIWVYPVLSGRVLPEPALRGLADHVTHGGTLIANEVYGGGFLPLFGFREMVPSMTHRRLIWSTTSPLTASFQDPKEQTLRLAPDDPRRAQPIGSYHFTQPLTTPLATYDDGTAAVLARSVGKGHAYVFGLDLGFLFMKGYTLREEGLTEAYDNRFEPVLDVFLRLIREIYRHEEPHAVTIHPVPHNRAVTVMLTHDIDAQTSMANALTYAALEQRHGIVGTYFVQTKYLRDFNDDILLTPQAVHEMQQLAQLGMELGSHTVAHSKVLDHFPMGTGQETFPEYAPFVHTRLTASNATVLGELRISKFLIDRLAAPTPIVSFRPGELSNPAGLAQALMATGYRYSSSATANNSLTHLPYQLTVSRAGTAETPIFEFPVTIEDEELPEMGSRVQDGIVLAQKIARYGGLVNVLIHPNILGHKYAFEEQFIQAVSPFAWFASVGQFGAWWAVRNDTDIDVVETSTGPSLIVQAPHAIEGLTLQIPPT